jgi:biotin carboxyl carrier protein
MEAMLDHGEGLLVPERMIVAPTVGVFRSADLLEGATLVAGQTVGTVDGPGTSTPVASPFAGRLVGMLAHPGERLREGQPVAWLRVQH